MAEHILHCITRLDNTSEEVYGRNGPSQLGTQPTQYAPWTYAPWIPRRQRLSLSSNLSCISTPAGDFYFYNTSSTAQRVARPAQEDVARSSYCQQSRPAHRRGKVDRCSSSPVTLLTELSPCRWVTLKKINWKDQEGKHVGRSS
jgi:hypothetical protein